MWQAILGSMVGGLVAGTIALVASAAGETDRDTPAGSSDAAIVRCEPHQQATMHRAIVEGREVSTVSCVSAMPAMAYAPAGAMYVSTASPVAMTPPEATVPAAVARPAVVRERVAVREAPRANRRSWGRTALVIGGTSGTGAGIGALIGGKKGALVGAAIGGGSGAIYEVKKRK